MAAEIEIGNEYQVGEMLPYQPYVIKLCPGFIFPYHFISVLLHLHGSIEPMRGIYTLTIIAVGIGASYI